MTGDVTEGRRGGESGAVPPLVAPPVEPRLGAVLPQQQMHSPLEPPQRAPQAQPIGQAQAAAQFHMARVFDRVAPNGSPTVDRQQLDPREVPALVAYLTQAPIALAAPGTTRDELVAAAPAAVPRVFHTDGSWIWPGAVGYYMSQYQLPPQSELLAHIRSRNYGLPQVPQEVRRAAATQILAAMNQQQPPQEAQQPQPQVQAQPQPQAQPVPQTPQPAPQQVADAPPVTKPAEFSAAFNLAGNRHAAWVGEQIEAFLTFLPEGDWSVDHFSRRYQQSGRDFLVDGLGTLSSAGVWTWAWADPVTWGRDTAIAEQSRSLRAIGDRDQIPELVTPALDISALADSPGDPQTAAEMICWTCMGLLTARGYIGHTATADGSGGRIYYVVCDESAPEARPTLENVGNFLMDGAAAFAENAADCTLGYIEHHGWEWSRVPDGIVVAAPGFGPFTALISPDGQLTGLALN
ncbi:MAG TPA: hypothetical protein VGZ32_04005 [Actinocrinis sp.]|jgi:hypothetical protein|uniref:DUF6882 domain-containing protein n=1 Tax=Actinocrinis sp. TaxID=1920516 RepID=UPI002DDCFBF6|nr:DUF6882 domain-containing protein [Actinocrinis sp.]HEV3169473.1 hypothetical protein [Actinocrinis sp.]